MRCTVFFDMPKRRDVDGDLGHDLT